MWIEQLAATTPSQHTALIAGGRVWRYGQWFRQGRERAQQLRAQGLEPGQVLVVRSSDAAEILELLYACAYLNCPLLPLNPQAPVPWYTSLLSRLPGYRRWQDGALLAGAPSATATATPPPRLIIATSGSSAEPKGVMLDGDALAAAARAANRRLQLRDADRWLLCLPLFHIGGLAVALRCAAAGATVVLHPGFEAQRVWNALWHDAISHLSLVPTMLHRLLEVAQGRTPPPGLRVVLVGGAPLSAALAQRARHWPVCASYGMSECGSQIATRCALDGDWQQGQVGQVLDGLELRVDATPGTVGPIRVRGAALMRGYLNPRLQPGDGLHHGWLETGDLGVLEGDGSLRVIGRADEMVISGGENVHPAQVESLLANCPGLREVAVCGEDDPEWGQRLVALFSGKLTATELERWARERLRGPWRPHRFVQVAALPRNSGGKLQRGALHTLLQGANGISAATPPDGPPGR